MGLHSPVARVLAGMALGVLAGAAVAWLSGPPPAVRLAAVVTATALLGGCLGWWLDLRFGRPLRRLRRRLEGAGTSADQAAGRLPRPVADLSAAIDQVTGSLGRQAAECEDEREHLVEILESMSDGVLITDRELRVEMINPAFRALFALQDLEVERVEASLSELLIGFIEELDADGSVTRERVETEAGRLLEVRGRRLSGDRSVVVAHDLTRQLRLNATIRDLVANVSHELRTPLAAIRGYAENLDEGALEQPRIAGRFVDRILAQCRRLEALLEDLLALSRIERSEEIPAAEVTSSVDLAALAGWAVETVGALAEERSVRIDFAPGPVPALPGSEEALETMLLNLLENAIKYNREGGSVNLTLSSGEGEVLIEVADTGIGVPQRDLDRIFERFYRVDRGRSRTEGGTGLGLAIVKHAAQLHGGRVEAESKVGRGSVFRVRLPAPG